MPEPKLDFSDVKGQEPAKRALMIAAAGGHGVLMTVSPSTGKTMLAERVEVLRGPASALYGSNAMGGVVNIVTRQMKEDGAKSHIRLSAGSYGTVQGELTQRIRKGKFSSIIGLNYGRTDGHRPDNTFEQYAGGATGANASLV